MNKIVKEIETVFIFILQMYDKTRLDADYCIIETSTESV